MKNKTYIYNKVKQFGFLIATAMLLTACGDSFLDHQPDERTELDTEAKAIDLLKSAYPDMNYGWMAEISSDNIMDNNAPHLPASTNQKQDTTHLNLSAMERGDDELFRFELCQSANSQDSPNVIWQTYYSSVATANAALEVIEKLEKEGKMSAKLKAARAEARIVRAYAHFVLVNLFSQAYKGDDKSRYDIGIPYVTKVESQVFVDYDRGNVAEVYRRIEQDLEAGLAEIDDINYLTPKYHFSVNATHAFAARFYLAYHKFDKVIEHANAVLGTGQANLPGMLLDYRKFADCTTMDDIGNCFQSTDVNDNIMLLVTYSSNIYHALGYRYAMNGLSARACIWHPSPTAPDFIITPCAYLSQQARSMSAEDGDYGYWSGKIFYKFQYTDKVAGIGYRMLVRREFTNSMLLLERAEAEAMLGLYADCAADLIAYEASRQTLSDEFLTIFYPNGVTPLTDALIQSWYGVGNEIKVTTGPDGKYTRKGHENCFDSWAFAANMGINVPDAAIPYMNCVNDFRRYEHIWEGHRFFDLKRWGIEYSHFIGPKNEEIRLAWDDMRRAIEVPQDAQSGGLQSSRIPAVNTEINAQEMRETAQTLKSK